MLASMSVKLARASGDPAYVSMAATRSDWESELQTFKAEMRAEMSSLRAQLLLDARAELKTKYATLAEFKALHEHVHGKEARALEDKYIKSLLRTAARHGIMDLIYWPFGVS